jgi:hypothetical protein
MGKHGRKTNRRNMRRRNTVKRKTMKRKTMKRKTMKRKTMKVINRRRRSAPASPLGSVQKGGIKIETGEAAGAMDDITKANYFAGKYVEIDDNNRKIKGIYERTARTRPDRVLLFIDGIAKEFFLPFNISEVSEKRNRKENMKAYIKKKL